MDVNRRTLLKGAGGSIVTLGVVGGAGLAMFGGTASATAGSAISDPNPVTSDDGKVTYVAVKATGRVSWDGFDTPAKKARIITRVRYKRSGQTLGEWQIHDTGKFDLTGDWGGAGEETHLAGDHAAGQSGYIASDVNWGIAQAGRENNYNNGYALPEKPAPTKPLYADADGTTQKTRVVLESVYLLYDGSGSELTGTSGYPDRVQTSSSFVVEVTNQKAMTSTGNKDAQGHGGDSATVGV